MIFFGLEMTPKHFPKSSWFGAGKWQQVLREGFTEKSHKKCGVLPNLPWSVSIWPFCEGVVDI